MALKSIPPPPDPSSLEFYRRALETLDAANVRYLVGGGFALSYYTGIVRHTKDLDIFVRPGESRYALDTLTDAGFRPEWPWPHFLARVVSGEGQFIDILYNSGNGLTPVDDEWFVHAAEGEFLGRRVLIAPAEETLWSKCFVQERDRFDGADVAHLLLRRSATFDWQRLLRRSQGHEAVLLAHLLLFHYVYPNEQRLPAWVMAELGRRAENPASQQGRVCRGTNLAPHQYRQDVEHWGFTDARRQPLGPLRVDDIARFAPPDAQPIR
jgi:hypothetical protein